MSPLFGFGLRFATDLLVERSAVQQYSKNFRVGLKKIGIVLPVLISPALAADRDAALDCVGIATAEERLACFDAAYSVAPMPEPSTSADAPASPAPVAAAVSATQDEGAKPIIEDEFGLPPQRPPDGTLKSGITRVERDSLDRLTFYLDNGQVWKQIESTYSPFRVKQDPAVAVIKSSALGSFKLTVEGGSRSVRVKRLE